MDEVLRSAGMFQGIDPADVEVLISQFEVLDAPRGTTLFREGEPGDDLYVVLGGRVKLSRTSPDGRENMVAVMGPTDQFGELSLFDPGPRTETAIVLADARLARLPKSALAAWMIERPQVVLQMLRVLARRLRRTNSMVADLIFVDVPGRLAKQLLQLAQRFGSVEGGQLRVTHDLTQEELAQLVGASRETVNKALADFEQRGWLRLEMKSVVILDRDRLARPCALARSIDASEVDTATDLPIPTGGELRSERPPADCTGECAMRKKLVGIFVSILALAGTLFVSNSSSQAAGTSVDLGMTGNTVAGFTKAQGGQELPVTFTMKNHSTTTSADVSFYYTLTHATANSTDYTCPLVSSHYNINPDTPACEPGVLGYGKSTSAAIMVTPTIASGTVTVKACAKLLDGHTDPVSSNNCKTVSIPIG